MTEKEERRRRADSALSLKVKRERSRGAELFRFHGALSVPWPRRTPCAPCMLCAHGQCSSRPQLGRRPEIHVFSQQRRGSRLGGLLRGLPRIPEVVALGKVTLLKAPKGKLSLQGVGLHMAVSVNCRTHADFSDSPGHRPVRHRRGGSTG